jgi:hypothetical protein
MLLVIASSGLNTHIIATGMDVFLQTSGTRQSRFSELLLQNWQAAPSLKLKQLK